MDKDTARGLHDAHEDNRNWHFAKRRAEAVAAAHDEQVRADERRRMMDRMGCELRSDSTGFSPGARGMI